MSNGAASEGYPTLHINQVPVGEGMYRVTVTLKGGGLREYTSNSQFAFQLTAQEQEDMRWYEEDYLTHTSEPAPTFAANIERMMSGKGIELFTQIFRSNDSGRKVWSEIQSELSRARVEISSEVRDATSIPWELLRDPETDMPLALRARSFVRVQSDAAQLPERIATSSGTIRILLVICRPNARGDVPFRSVASRIIKGLSDEARKDFELVVLRPPTLERLSEVLHEAKDQGEPFHVVHFDGHGTFVNIEKVFEQWKVEEKAGDNDELKRLLQQLLQLDPSRYSPQVMYPRPLRDERRGYLVFENPENKLNNIRLVDGPELGQLMAETGVSVLVLNACLSAYADPPAKPVQVSDGNANAGDDSGNVHEQVKAFGSLAQEVVDAGVRGVVAMRYSVYVVTAAQFVASMYEALRHGYPLGEAVRRGRRNLYDDPYRTLAYEPVPLQDWIVPIVYEATPIPLFPRQSGTAALQIEISDAAAAPKRGQLDASLPPSPEVGFFGRDDVLLALDRAFDKHHLVLLHAYAGSGKTTTAAEFARWYSDTSGIDGPVLYTSFEQYRPLARVLDTFGQMFGPTLVKAGIPWLAINDEKQRVVVVLDVLRQVPVLWVWDNVEPITGFPEGNESQWSAAEQQELKSFLVAAKATKAKFLLTSRRDERKWLGDHAFRVTMPRMPMQERVQLAAAIAENNGRKIDDVEDWWPLLRFTDGNPLTITVVVGQALRDGLHTKEQIEAYVQKLRAGEAVFADDESEGRSKSLGASLGYGFAHSFSESERQQLALLHFFQGFVNVTVLRVMGDPDADWCVPAVRGLTREAGIALLNRAAELGLLIADGAGFYSIHPALPWFFKREFDRAYTADPLLPTRAFVAAEATLAQYYKQEIDNGQTRAFNMLAAEEDNLLHAWQLARGNRWLDRVGRLLQPLLQLYKHTGRNAELDRLLAVAKGDYFDPTSGGPQAGLEEDWSIFSDVLGERARVLRQWAEAERIFAAQVAWQQQQAAEVLTKAADQRSDDDRNLIRSLAVSLFNLGDFQANRNNPAAAAMLEQAVAMAKLAGDQQGEAATANSLGHVYLNILALRDLDKAEHWYTYSLKLKNEADTLGRAGSYYQLGVVAYERFDEARKDKRIAEVLAQAQEAEKQFRTSLQLMPKDALSELATVNNGLGNLYGDVGLIDQALPYFGKAIECFKQIGDNYHVATTQYNVAATLWRADRNREALIYAQAAGRGFADLGEAEMVQKTHGLIDAIEKKMREKGEQP